VIFRQRSRTAALLLIFAVACAVGLFIAPLTLVPVMFEEASYLRDYRYYFEALVGVDWIDHLDQVELWIFIGTIALWAGLQVVFLSPIVGRPAVGSYGRSLLPSVIAAAFIGSLGCAMLWVALIEGLLAVVSVDSDQFGDWYGSIVGMCYLTGLAVWIGGGFLWYVLLSRAGSPRNPAGLDRLVRRVFAGTCIELLIGVLLYLQVRRRTECYCAMASFWSIVLGAATLFWMCGPWVVLLLTRKERLAWARGACAQCGYPRRTDSDVCTECGARHVPAGARH
jgi:hypothetical protein